MRLSVNLGFVTGLNDFLHSTIHFTYWKLHDPAFKRLCLRAKRCSQDQSPYMSDQWFSLRDFKGFANFEWKFPLSQDL